MAKINILHLYQNSKIGGVQQQIFSLIKSYNKDLFNPIFCCLGNKEKIAEKLEQHGIEVITLNRTNYNRLSFKIIKDLYKIIKEKNIHILRTHRYRSNLYGRIAGWLAGVPVIISSVHDNYRSDKKIERKLMNKILSIITDKIVAVSESIKNDIIRYDKINPSKIEVINNGVDTLIFRPQSKDYELLKSLGINNDDIVIGFVGRIVPAKGLEYLLEAFSYLKKEINNIKLLIVGDGAILKDLKNYSIELGISKYSIFTGERQDIQKILSCIDIFVMPSIAEGLPNALLEAMSSGKTVVTTKVGGIPEIIKDRFNGLIIPDKNSEMLAKAIKELITDKDLSEKLGENARHFIIENYSIEAVNKKWETLYLSILREKKGKWEKKTTKKK
jgi:glycosyltransferase involved in cell wall biosynthesis